jgi:two-component system phosphate regulon sensor histidine kinase PhoR
MIRNRLLWRLFSLFLLIGLSALFVISWYGSRSFKDFYIGETAQDLRFRSQLLIPLLKDHIEDISPVRVDNICKEYGEIISSRITVVLPDGQVIGDTEADPSTMDNHSDRVEILTALGGNVGKSIRYSHTIDTDMLYVAIPVYDHDQILAVIRISIALTSLEKAVLEANREIFIGALLMAFLIAIASFVISRKISKPLEIIKNGADRFASGDLDHKIHVNASEELNSLADAMNNMALELKNRIIDVERQRNEKEAVFDSMVEGVLAVDLDERIISINRAAAGLLGINIEKAAGQTIQEAIRNARLQMLITKTLQNNESTTDEIIIYDGQELYLQANGTPLENNLNKKIGVLVVLENITRLKKLENIRREFVANVSHELKTPITSIKGYIETLMDSPDMNKEEMRKFLEIADKHANRLGAIVDDLLQLSSIERDLEKGGITPDRGKIYTVVENAILFCQSKANQKKIKINLACSSDLEANINSQLLEQAIINLIDNAINFSEPGELIDISARKSQAEIIVEVKDNGCGIESEHLPRLFERFYRVDKSRSRHKGGTGLGLSIVKHIAQAHGGYPSVDSTPDKGSIFRIHLPD